MVSYKARTAIWPARASYIAAALFTLASGGANLVYGFGKGTDTPSSLIWAGVSLGVSIVFALSWPALIKSLDAKNWSRAAIVAVALLMTGTYSVAAALGSAAGGRENAATAHTTATNDRARTQKAYDKAEKELTKIPETRPVQELEVLVAAARPVCRVHVAKGDRQTVCTKPPALETELARAKQRAKLQADMDSASTDLKSMGAPKVANSDAVALEAYFQGLGFEVTADRLNKLLVLLAVLVIECGGGLALAVGMSLSGEAEHREDERTSGRTVAEPDTRTPGPDTSAKAAISQPSACPPHLVTPLQLRADVSDKNVASVRFLAFLAERGGVLVSGQREIGRALGWSKSWTHEVLHELAGAGLVKLTTGRTGTVVKLKVAAA